MPTLLTSGLVIEHLAWRVRNYRFLRRGAYEMAMELKGLKGKALKARASLDALNTAYDKFNVDAAAHAADVTALTKDLEGMQSDLQFATATLGNSVGASGVTQEPPGEKQVITPADVGKLVPESAQAQQAAIEEVGQAAHGTFPDQMQQVRQQ